MRISLTAVEDFGLIHATYTIPNDITCCIKLNRQSILETILEIRET